jgi:hypothetical protein
MSGSILTQWCSWVDDTTLSVVRFVVCSDIIFVVALGSWLGIRNLVVVQSVGLAVHSNFDSTVIHEELVLLLQSRESLLDDASVVGVLYVDADHLCEKLRIAC